LGAVGLATLATGWVGYTLWFQDEWHEWYERIDNKQSFAAATLPLTSAAAVLLSVSTYWLIPDDPGVPTWAWLTGGVGALTAVTGLGFAVFHWTRSDNQFVPLTAGSIFTQGSMFAPMLLLHALPLLAVPLSYLLRRALRSSESLAIGLQVPTGGGFELGVHGRFE
jgi:hypothetical protein